MENTYVVYKSVTGFTRDYALAIARALGCEAVRIQDADLPPEARVIYSGRMLAGSVDGLKNWKGPKPIAIFAVGAMPGSITETLDAIWKQNLTEDELESIPHFYFQGGLRYNKMPVIDWLFMKMFAAMVTKKKDRTEYEQEAARIIGHSFDRFDEANIAPLVEILK